MKIIYYSKKTQNVKYIYLKVYFKVRIIKRNILVNVAIKQKFIRLPLFYHILHSILKS